jgi:hypothetical protein
LRMHGLTWERLNDLRKARAMPKREFVCVRCGKSGESVHPLAKFCSHECCVKERNDKGTELRAKERAECRGEADCPVCGLHFKRTRLDQVNCTRRCTMIAAKRRINSRIGHKPTPQFYRV